MKRIILVLFFLSFHNRGNTQCHQDDFTALRELYFGTDGDNWDDTVGWHLVRDHRVPPINCDLSSMSGITRNYFGDFRVSIISISGLNGPIPQSIELLDDLERLKIKDSEITDFPNTSDGMPNLTTVQITNAALTTFPTVLFNFNTLQKINLSDNNFNTEPLSPDIGLLTELQELKIENSVLKGPIPKEIGNLTKLIELDLDNNNLSKIPDEIGQLTYLRVLSLNSNNIQDSLPSTVGNLDSLRWLSLTSNNFGSPLPSSIGDLNKLFWLDLFKSGFTGPIPKEIGQLSNLFNFRGSFNDFTSLPGEIGQCSELRTLELSVSLIDSIPNGIGDLDSLTKFSMSSSQVSYIDPDIGGLENIEYLHLNENPLQSIPSEIGALETLKFLSFYDCELESLPSSIENLDNLTILDLSHNELSGHVPCQLGSMDSLQWLDITFNNFNGCYDTNLLSLCGAQIGIGQYEDIFGKGNNLPDWDQFCLDQAYTCPSYHDTIYWEFYDTVTWSQRIVWDGRQVPSEYEKVHITVEGDALSTTGAPRYIEIDSAFRAQAYTLEIDQGVEFSCPPGATLEVYTAANYTYQSVCQE